VALRPINSAGLYPTISKLARFESLKLPATSTDHSQTGLVGAFCCVAVVIGPVVIGPVVIGPVVIGAVVIGAGG
jgi:hypothetical protein